MIAVNKTANTITVRATTPVMQILERIIEQNDKPRAEIIVDVVDPRGRSQSHEELRPEPVGLRDRRRSSRQSWRRAADDAGGGTAAATRQPRRGSGSARALRHRRARSSPPPFNLNTISRGVSTADFYLAVPDRHRAVPRDRHATPRLSRSRSCAAPKAASCR